ncbi:hypothetical protein [Actinocorallia longicatena]|uniref:Uncharacterized protein n=1 Tax=Actinocorallia longicatena TaxID=111803 RepID=A0ABP6QAG1_9ACTN
MTSVNSLRGRLAQAKTSTFWRTELKRQLAAHRAAGHMSGGFIENAYVDDHLLSTADRAGREELAETVEHMRIVGAWNRDKGAQFVEAVLTRHRQEQEAKEQRALRVARLRLGLAMRSAGIDPLTDAERAALDRAERRRRLTAAMNARGMTTR